MEYVAAYFQQDIGFNPIGIFISYEDAFSAIISFSKLYDLMLDLDDIYIIDYNCNSHEVPYTYNDYMRLKLKSNISEIEY